jgi:hypothetical protein
MKINTLYGAKLGTDSTDANFCLRLNAEVKNSEKKETVRLTLEQ